MKKISNKMGAIALGASMAIGSGIAMPMTVFAANGIQDPAPNGYTYTTTDDRGTGSWDANDGKVNIIYDTTNGTWKDSQYPDDGTDTEKENHTHKNGTYLVRIPKAIKYEGMNVGTVNTSDDYDVTVEGVLAAYKSVDVKAETGKKLTGTELLGDITETTSLKDATAGGAAGAYSDTNFHNFSASQTSVMTGDKVTGTTVQDNISLAGKALSAGTYRGTVQYSSALIDSSPSV